MMQVWSLSNDFKSNIRRRGLRSPSLFIQYDAEDGFCDILKLYLNYNFNNRLL